VNEAAKKFAVPHLRDLKFFSEENADLSEFFRSLDFCSTFYQEKVEKRKEK
jgi:hypothetical protein